MLSVICSGLFVILSAVLMAVSFAIPGASDWDVVGSRLVPQIYIAGMGACSCIVFALSVAAIIRDPSKLPEKGWPAALLRDYGGVLIVFAALFACFIGIELVGFYVSSFVFLLFLQWVLNRYRMNWTIAWVSALSPVVIYFLFERGLKVLMPAGILFS